MQTDASVLGLRVARGTLVLYPEGYEVLVVEVVWYVSGRPFELSFWLLKLNILTFYCY